MTQEHPITPPPELVQQWWDGTHGALYEFEAVVTQAARWGADMELEACIAWMMQMGYWGEDGKAVPALRAARRPKPPSLKELALTQLDSLHADLKTHGLGTNTDTIRRALEQLND
jgi:hypothetical protein